MNRFEFLVERDGREKAILFLQENIIKTYRIFLLKNKGMIKRRKLIEKYLEAKKIVRENQ